MKKKLVNFLNHINKQPPSNLPILELTQLALDYDDICSSGGFEYQDDTSFYNQLVQLYNQYKGNDEANLPRLFLTLFSKLDTQLEQINQETAFVTKQEEVPCKQEYEEKKPERFEFLRQHFKVPALQSFQNESSNAKLQTPLSIQKRLAACTLQDNKLLQLIRTLNITKTPDNKQLMPPSVRPKKKNTTKYRLLEKQYQENLQYIHKTVFHKLRYLAKTIKKQKRKIELETVNLKVLKNVFLINKDQNQSEKQLYELMKKEIPNRIFNHRELKEQIYMGIYLQIGTNLKGNREMKSNQFLLNQLLQGPSSGKYEWYDASLKLMRRLKLYLMNRDEKFNLKDAVTLKLTLIRFLVTQIIIEDYPLIKQVEDFIK